MKILSMAPNSDESLRLLTQSQHEKKTANIQDILNGVNNTSTSANSSQVPFYLGITEVLPCLYLCGACAIVRPETIESLSIKFVVNATIELPDTPLPDVAPEYFRVPVKDTREANLLDYFDQVADLIEETRQKHGRSLVHCLAGVSRSVSLVLAYLMKYSNMSLKSAFQHVRSVRPQVRPNVGFFKQLIEYEQRLNGITTVSMIRCSAVDEEIPDVYEPEYQTLELMYQKYRRNFARR